MQSHALIIERLQTGRRSEIVDVTEAIRRIVRQKRVTEGMIIAYVPHTTAAVTINENYDPDVTTDLERAWAKWVPDVRFDHDEGNSPAHFLSEAIGTSRLIPMENGKPKLGRWQGIFLIELDGPRERTVEVTGLKGED